MHQGEDGITKAGKPVGLTSYSNVPEAVNAAADSKFYEVVMASYHVVCQNGWKVSEKINDIARLRDVPSSFLV